METGSYSKLRILLLKSFIEDVIISMAIDDARTQHEMAMKYCIEEEPQRGQRTYGYRGGSRIVQRGGYVKKKNKSRA